MENFMYQWKRKVSQNLLLKLNQAICISTIFVGNFGAKRD